MCWCAMVLQRMKTRFLFFNILEKTHVALTIKKVYVQRQHNITTGRIKENQTGADGDCEILNEWDEDEGRFCKKTVLRV